MTSTRKFTLLRVFLAVALLLAIGILAGCSGSNSSSTPKTPNGATAMAAAKIALSTLSTTAPDGRILVGQAAEPLTATSTPIWEFLIGNPKTDIMYAVLVQAGKGQSQEYGKAGLSATEWTQVPAFADWKIDSDVAIANALKIYPGGKQAEFVPGFVTYVPKSAKNSTTKPMTWIISFDPASKGSAATSTVEVDMKTGEAKLATK